MRHNNKVNALSRKSAHRQALLMNMANSLIQHKRINTTVAKAKALKKYIEPLLTKSKNDTTHSRRMVFSYLQDKHAVSELFRDIAPKIANRPGGYTRIIKTGFRPGDSAEMCLIELVDYNELYSVKKDGKAAAKKTRRSRRGSAKTVANEVSTTEGKKEVENKVEEVKGKTESSDAVKAESKKETSAKSQKQEDTKVKEDETSSEENKKTEE